MPTESVFVMSANDRSRREKLLDAIRRLVLVMHTGLDKNGCFGNREYYDGRYEELIEAVVDAAFSEDTP